MQFRGIRALAAASGADMTIGVMCTLGGGADMTIGVMCSLGGGADMTIGVMCTLGGAQATEKAAQLGLLLMCRFRFEEYQPTYFNKSPQDIGPSDIAR